VVVCSSSVDPVLLCLLGSCSVVYPGGLSHDRCVTGGLSLGPVVLMAPLISCLNDRTLTS